MIICSLQAENLLKYRKLRLDELPERGVIAVSGDNETGKSAIGEIICFALFGRTYSLAADELRKLVRWGSVQGRVSLRFNSTDQTLAIIRHVDRGGKQSARLVRPERPQEPVARGLVAVKEQMEQLLGYDFDQYVETFYLAQREITTPQPHSPSVKAMAGIVPFERCVADLRQEIERDETSASRLERQLAEAEAKLASLNPNRLRVGDIERDFTYQAQRDRQLAERISALDAAVEGYTSACRGLRSHSLRRGLAEFLQVLIYLLLVVAVGLWTFLLFKPSLWPLPALRERLEEQVVATGLPLEPTLAYAISALLGMLVLVWLWNFTLNLGLRRRRARARHLGEELRLVDELEPLPMSREGETTAKAPEVDDVALEQSAPLDKPDSERRTSLVERVLKLEATPDEVRAAARYEITWMERGRDLLEGQRETLVQTLENARYDQDEGRRLQDKCKELAWDLDARRSRIETEQLSVELLQGAARQVADNFNDHLRNLVSRNLPRFTDGRYEYLEIGDDLQVRVYSNEKRGFLDIEEISSGTQRQILLALRLALAQERMSRIAKDRQFAFLDEPFAFFDDTRMRGALRLLPKLSDFITQHWVVAQRFPRDEFLALEIPCGNHADTLKVGMAEISRQQL